MKKALLIISLLSFSGMSLAQCHLGNDTDLGETSSHAPNYLLGSEIVVTSSVNVTDMGMIAINAGDNFKVAIYDDAGGNPGNLLTEGAGTTVVGDNIIDVPDVTLAPGTYYYMAVFETQASVSYTTNTSATVWYISHTYSSALPNSFGTPQVYTGQEFSYYLVTSVDVGTSLNGLTISADNTSATSYYWIDCNTNLPIPGETSSSFTATNNGNYACVITDGACSDTSQCTLIDFVGLDEYDYSEGINVYPNPTSNSVNFDADFDIYRIEILSMDSKSMMNSAQTKIDISALPEGVYFARIETEKGMIIKRIVKK